MRLVTLTAFMLITGAYSANAQQFTVLPQVGFELSRTTIQYNNLPSFAPVNNQLSPRLGLRMDYKFKQAHGPFMGIATSRSGVSYQFQNAETGMTSYKASAGDLRVHVEAGYQMSTKPIYFSKPGSANKSVSASRTNNSVKKRCGGYTSRMSSASKLMEKNSVQPANKGWYMSVQPFAGVALIRALSSDINSEIQGNQITYQYQAGNWNSALIAGAGFEFGKSDQRKFTISMNYLKGIGNLDTRAISTTTAGKTTVTQLESSVQSWNVTAGIPITIFKKKVPVKQIVEQKQKPEQNKMNYENKCRRYQYRCTRSI